MLANGLPISSATELLCIKINCPNFRGKCIPGTKNATPVCTKARMLVWQLPNEMCPELKRKLI